MARTATQEGKTMIRKAAIAALGLILVLIYSSCASTGYVAVVSAPSKAFQATVTGRVVYGSHSVHGARVVVNRNGQHAYTGANGYFTIHLRTTAPAGVHRISISLTASKPGFSSRTVGLGIRERATTSVRINLRH